LDAEMIRYCGESGNYRFTLLVEARRQWKSLLVL
jgi:hypothetical protein